MGKACPECWQHALHCWQTMANSLEIDLGACNIPFQTLMSIQTTWGPCQNAYWDSGGWECGLRSAFLTSSQWEGYSWSSNQMFRSKDLKSIKIKLGNGIYKNSTAVPVSVWWGSLIILSIVLLSIEQHKSTSLSITTVLSVKYDFHFTDNKTEAQKKKNN